MMNIRRKILKKIRNAIRSSIIPESLALNETNAVLLNNHVNLTYGDQKGQVSYLVNCIFNYQNNGLPKAGYFVDLACADGVEINNTYFLEKYLGWDGLLFEPNPGYKENIDKNRNSKLITKCVTDEANSTVRFRVDNGMLGGIVSDVTDNNPNVRGGELKSASILEIETTTLGAELAIAGAPSVIDFISLDIEGAEYLALKNFPFNDYKFRCLAIERPNVQLDLLLDFEGYRQVAHLMNDVIYVHKDFISEMNFHPDVQFAFTPSKDW